MYKRPYMAPFGGDSYRGAWEREKIMGKGAFGAVVLWKNEETGQQICIKECHGMELSERQKTQWQTECKIMLKLRHPNVVRGLPTPKELDTGMRGIPVLALEYCQGGDLRKVLNKPENACGLPEIQVYAITRDISLAVEYLHSKNVVHRDLKPENIVMKPMSNNKLQYKLIDLGYAKDVSHDSLCKSFVGTEQYLAPELFTSANIPGQHYNNNVDYWCLGTTVFECIVGFRPFFHGIPAVQWLRHVSEKKPEQICGIMNLENEVVFSKHLPTPHFLCRHSVQVLEQWLQLMLMYDAGLRGGGIVNGRPVCFNQLDSILKINILHLYNVSTNVVLSYPVYGETQLGDITQQLPRDYRSMNLEFLSANGSVFREDKLAIRCCGPQDEMSLMFLVPSSPCQFVYHKRPHPELVQYLMSTDSKGAQIPFDLIKRSYTHFVYYIRESNRDYQRLLQAQKALSMYLMTRKKDLTKERNHMSTLLRDLRTRIAFFNDSIQLDLLKLEGLKSTGIYSGKMIGLWHRTKDQVAKFLQMDQDVEQLSKQSEALESSIMDMNKVPINRNENFGQGWEKRVIEIYERLRRTPKEERSHQLNHSDIIKCTVDYTTENSRQMVAVYEQITTILEFKQQVLMLSPYVIDLQNKLLHATDKVATFQKQRQNDIWGFFHELCKSVDVVDSSHATNHIMDTSNTHATMATNVSPMSPMMSPPVPMVHNSGTSSSMRCNSSLMIEKANEESISLRNESLSSIQKIQRTVSTIQQAMTSTVPTPDWSFLDQDEDSMIQD